MYYKLYIYIYIYIYIYNLNNVSNLIIIKQKHIFTQITQYSFVECLL